MDYIVHGILEARILEWVAFPFSRGSTQPRDGTQVSHIAGRFFTNWTTNTALTNSFPSLEPICCFMSGSNCCLLTSIQIFQEAGKVVWYSHLLKNFPQFVVIYTIKDFGVINKAEVDVFLDSLAFSMIQWMLAILSLGKDSWIKCNPCYQRVDRKNEYTKTWYLGFPGGSVTKNLPANVGDLGLIPGLGRFHMPWSN